MATDFTPHYNLDKYVATDKPNLRDQYNAAMDKIDLALLSANTNATEAKNTVLNFDEDLSNLQDALPLSAFSQSTVQQALNGKASTSALSAETTARENAVSAEATARANADTALSSAVDGIKDSAHYMLAIGNSWLVHNGYGAYLTAWMQSMYGATIHCYGRSGAGWLTPYNNQLIQDAVTEAINAHQSTGYLCSDIFLLEMQNDQNLFTSSDNPAGYVEKIKEQVNRLKAVFPKAKFHYVIDNAKSTSYSQYRNFCRCMERNFAFDFIHTLFFFDQASMLDTAHIANTLNGYGRLAQIFYRAATGGEQTYPLMQFNLVSDTANIINTSNVNRFVQLRGDPLKDVFYVRFQCSLIPGVASGSNRHTFRIDSNAYNVNTTLMQLLQGNGCGYSYINAKSLNFVPAYLSVIAGGDWQLMFSPEMVTWLGTTQDAELTYITQFNTAGLYPY